MSKVTETFKNFNRECFTNDKAWEDFKKQMDEFKEEERQTEIEIEYGKAKGIVLSIRLTHG